MDIMNYIYLTVLIVKTVICQESFRVNRDHLNKRLLGHVLFDMQVESLHKCIYECMFLGACESFNYMKVNSLCEINDISSDLVTQGELVTEPGTIFADITEYPPAMVGGCANHKCGYYKRCYPAGKGHFCADIDCGSLPSIKNGTLSLDSLSSKFGATASVKCNSGYYPKTITTVCKASGEWEKANCLLLDCESVNGLEWVSLPSSKIQVQTQSKTHAQAAIACGTAGAKLVKIDEKWKMDLVVKILSECKAGKGFDDQFWVDGSNSNAVDYFAPGAWRFSDGSLVPMDRYYWNRDAPDIPASDHCFRMLYPTYKFDDQKCNKMYGFICEKQIIY